MLLLLYGNPILIAAAVIPAIVLLVYVYRTDRLEKEPGELLLGLVLRGVFATFLALCTERLGTWLLLALLPADSVAYRVLLYFVVVAGSEEGFKYLLMRRRTWYAPSFNCQFDGVVYAVFTGLGFALWENISYVLMYGFGTAVVRALTAVPGHACFGVFMGAWYGMARRYENSGDAGKSRACRSMAVLLPALLHGCYDYVATMTWDGGAWIFVGFVAVLFVLAWRLVRRLARNDRYIGGGMPPL